VSIAELTKTAKFKVFMWTLLVFIVLDQATKIWVVDNIPYGRGEIELLPGFLSLVHAQNRGAAMGMLDTFEYRMHVFAVFTVVALVVLGQMLMQLPDDDRFQGIGLGLITSGAIGNAIDRVHKQSVTDFIRVYTDDPELSAWLISTPLRSAEWPSFNVADAAIVVGLGMFVIHWLFLEKDEEVEPAPPQEPLADEG
jgi:signal peptidase II